MYCDVDDVLSVATAFRQWVEPDIASGSAEYRPNTNTIARSEIEAIIEEVSLQVQSILEPRYDVDVINAYVVVPPMVKSLTKYKSASILYERYNVVDIETNFQMQKLYEKSIAEYMMNVVNGLLRDADGNKIPSLTYPSIQLGSDSTDFLAEGRLEELYENGERTY